MQSRENYLRHRIDEIGLDEHITYAIYFRNLIYVERQINIYYTIHKYTFS